MLQLSSALLVNSVVWIRSLNADEQGTTERVHDDLVPYFLSHQIPFVSHEPQTATELLEYLDIRQHCTGPGVVQRRERLVSEAIAEGIIVNNRHGKRGARKTIKNTIRPTQALIDKYVAVFLLGKKISLQIRDVLEMVQKTIANEEKAQVRKRKLVKTR